MPGTPRRYDVRAIARWRQTGNAAKEQAQADGPLAVQKLKAEIDKLRAEVKGRNLKNDAAEGNLILRVEAEQTLSELCAMIRGRLESFPDEFEPRFPAATRGENRADLDEAIHQLLKEMSECELPSEADDDQDDDAASTADE